MCRLENLHWPKEGGAIAHRASLRSATGHMQTNILEAIKLSELTFISILVLMHSTLLHALFYPK